MFGTIFIQGHSRIGVLMGRETLLWGLVWTLSFSIHAVFDLMFRPIS